MAQAGLLSSVELFDISLEAERLAMKRGAPPWFDIVLLVPFWAVATLVCVVPPLVLQPSAEGLGAVSAFLLTAGGYLYFNSRNRHRCRMIQDAFNELREEAEARATAITENGDVAPLGQLPRWETQVLGATKKLMELPDRTPSQRAAGARVIRALEGRAWTLARRSGRSKPEE